MVENKNTKCKMFIIKLVLVFIGIFLGLVFLEISAIKFRLSEDNLPLEFINDNNYNYKIKPLYSARSFWGIEYKINSEGFRDIEYTIKKNKNIYRILLLGDSVTFGYAVNYNDTFSTKLRDKVIENFHERHIEIINSGVPGYNLQELASFLEMTGIEYEPDLVIYTVISNDFLPSGITVGEGGILVDKGHYTSIPLWLKKRLRNSASYWTIAKIFRYLTYKNKFLNFNDNNTLNIQKQMEERYKTLKENNEIYLNKIIELSNRKNFKLLIVFFPTKEDIINESLERSIIKEFSDNNKLPYIDLTSSFNKYEVNNLFLDNSHPNPYGHTIIADEIFKAINYFQFLK